MRVLRHLNKLKIDVAMLQETHLRKENIKRMCKFWLGELVGLGARDKKAGVLILLRKNMALEVSTTDADEEGRQVSITVTHRTTSFRLTNIYALNSPLLIISKK